jgi:hypothetical protein
VLVYGILAALLVWGRVLAAFQLHYNIVELKCCKDILWKLVISCWMKMSGLNLSSFLRSVSVSLRGVHIRPPIRVPTFACSSGVSAALCHNKAVPSYVLGDDSSTKLSVAYKQLCRSVYIPIIHGQPLSVWWTVSGFVLHLVCALVSAPLAHHVQPLASGGSASTTFFDSPACSASDARRPAYVGIASWSVHPWQDELPCLVLVHRILVRVP